MNKEEVLTGCVYGLAWAAFIGWWSVPLVVVCGFLWAFGGAAGTSKSWRRWGVPLAVCVAIALTRWSWIPLVSIVPFFAVLTIGYGIPSVNPIPEGDAGSWLGRLCTKMITGSVNPPPLEDEEIINWVCRGIIAMLTLVAMGSLLFIHVMAWVIAGVILILGTIFVEND